MSRHKRIRGLDLKSNLPPCACRVCDLCKNKKHAIRKVVKHEDQIKYEDGLESFSMDHIVVNVTARGGHKGARGAHLITHHGCRDGSKKEPTRYVQTYPVVSKGAAPSCAETFTAHIKSRFNRQCRHGHFDNAKEYTGKQMQRTARAGGWFPTYSPAYTAVKNRHSEKTNHLICEMALCLMVRGGAATWAWALALVYATYVYNRKGTSLGGKSPLELISGVVPDCSMFRVFWCPTFPLHFKQQGRGKFVPTSRGTLQAPCRMAGISPDHPDCWLYYNPWTDTCSHAAHVRFDESHYDGTQLVVGEEPAVTTEEQLRELVEALGDIGVSVPSAAAGRDHHVGE